jgi:hypothetical protein
MKYTFICEDQFFSKWKNSIEFECDTIDEVVENFNLFLRGSGFNFQLGVIEDEETQSSYTENNSSDDSMKFILDSLSMWQSDANRVQNQIEKCEVCELPSNIVSRYNCTDPICPVK